MTLPRLAVTTAVRHPAETTPQAEALARELLGAAHAPRRDLTLPQMFQETGAERLLIVEHRRLLLRDAEGAEYFFHPNLALVRGLNILRGAHDLFADATGLTAGERLLDCTLGFAGEATLAALLVGAAGRVVGLESVPELAAVTRDGVARFGLQTRPIEEALRRVEVVTADYRVYLPRCAAMAFDVVYFDPFFGERLPGSGGSVSPLARFGDPAPLDVASVWQARHVARRCVVIKHPKTEALPPELASEVAHVVMTRRSQVQYDVLPAISARNDSEVTNAAPTGYNSH